MSHAVRSDRLTYLDEAKLANLETCLVDVNRSGVPGDVCETGVALGGSAIVLASLMGGNRSFHGYDLFARIPAPSERDGADAHNRFSTIASGESTGIDGDPYYGYVDDLFDTVVHTFERYGLPVDGNRISLHRGLLEETFDPDEPVALAHIDCDWYDPVLLSLERVYPQLAPGGYIILDDYNDYSGCRTATDEFLAANGDLDVVADNANLVARKVTG